MTWGSVGIKGDGLECRRCTHCTECQQQVARTSSSQPVYCELYRMDRTSELLEMLKRQPMTITELAELADLDRTAVKAWARRSRIAGLITIACTRRSGKQIANVYQYVKSQEPSPCNS